MWVLIVEDDFRLADLIRRGLEAEGFTVAISHDGVEGEELATLNRYDALIVDWSLPKQDGRTLIKNLRSSGIQVPAIMLTALGDVEHRVAGLEAGADDYLPKPFSFEELVARLRAVTRRPPIAEFDHILTAGSVLVNSERRTVEINGEPELLRPKEFALLEMLLRRKGDVISRSVLAERIWGSALYVTDNVIDVTISGLRSKLNAGFKGAEPDLEIITVRGVGYSAREIETAA
ncbi:MAG: DNA-binding response OmpR family regulator [Rhodothermales bacterium]|jgi:DNA-binding response OmpR family regulator